MSKRSSDEMDSLETSLMGKKIATSAVAKLPRGKKATKSNVEGTASQLIGKKLRLGAAMSGCTPPTPEGHGGEAEKLQVIETEKAKVGACRSMNCTSPESYANTLRKTDTESDTVSPGFGGPIDRGSKDVSPMQHIEKSKINATTYVSSPDCGGSVSVVIENVQLIRGALDNIRDSAQSLKRSSINPQKDEPTKKVKMIELASRKPTAPQSPDKANTVLESNKTRNNNGEGKRSQKEMCRKTTPRATTLPSPSPSSSPVGESTSPSTPTQPNNLHMANTPSPSGSEYEEDADVDDEEPTAAPSKGQTRIKRKIAPAATAIRGDYQSEDDDDIQPSGKRVRLAHAAAKAMLSRPSSKAKPTTKTSSFSSGSSWADSSDGSFKKPGPLGVESGSPSSSISAYETDASTSRVRQRAAGLRNHGKSCFHNSVLQCLAHTKPIREHYATAVEATLDSSTSSEAEGVMEKRVSAAGRVETRSSRATKRAVADVYKDVNPDNINLSAIFGKLLARMVYEREDQGATPHVSPMHFTQAYAAIYGGDYDGEASQDAHETLNQTLNRLKDEERALGNTSTMVESVFQGIVFNHFTCKRCGHENNMTDDFMELGVTMPGLPSGSAKRRGGHVTLAQCFDTFREQEEFPDRKCRDCSATGGVSKVSSLGHVPSHLAVQIRRWRQVVGRRGRVSLQKIDTKVNFPVQEAFDLSPWVSDATAAGAGDLNYELYGVVEHHGSGLNDGHYIAYVKRDDGWWEMDDEYTTQVKPGSVGRANPYLLFYRKE